MFYSKRDGVDLAGGSCYRLYFFPTQFAHVVELLPTEQITFCERNVTRAQDPKNAVAERRSTKRGTPRGSFGRNRLTAAPGTCYHYEMNILNIKAFGGLLFLLLAMAALLFIPAWALNYWQAWTFLAVYFSSSLAITLYLMKKDPKLLERRMSGGPTAEKQTTQKVIMLFASLGFIGLIVFPALDHRFAWSCRRVRP